ncbi:hypothetical protein Tco_0956236 [Tanacetum coccineum]|uniref:Uncharacterized protein n=1 Tax=Tanacetum coccineum TaxID=301880 RepID=A0ABQ5E9F4_9ASTR
MPNTMNNTLCNVKNRHMSYNANENNIVKALIQQSNRYYSESLMISIRVLAAEEIRSEEGKYHKPDFSKASSAGGKIHILKPSCERNGITPTPKENLSPTSGSKVPNSPLTGKNEESYKFPIAVQQSFNSLWSQDVRGDPDSGIGGLQIQCCLRGPPHHDFSLMDILPGKSTRYAI